MTYNAADKLQNIQPGDAVERLLYGMLPMPLVVTAVTEDRITCGSWEFSRCSGAEIDEELGWTDEETGSVIRPLAA